MADRDGADAVSVTERSEEQAANEAALAEVEATIINIETAIRRAERAESALRVDDAHTNLAEAVSSARQELAAVRRRLQQSSFFAAEDGREYADQVAMFDDPEVDGDQPPLL